jgi:hypothetical protein
MKLHQIVPQQTTSKLSDFLEPALVLMQADETFGFFMLCVGFCANDAWLEGLSLDDHTKFYELITQAHDTIPVYDDGFGRTPPDIFNDPHAAHCDCGICGNAEHQDQIERAQDHNEQVWGQQP